MNQSTSALAEMRRATHSIHEQLEKHLPVAAPGAGKTEYVEYLQDLWGWIQPFEEALWRAPWPPEMQAERRAGKLAWIESDLRDAGFDDAMIASIPVAPFKPDLGSLPARFGLAYVIEGAQLGTRVLSKTLGPRLAPWYPRWLRGYGDENAYRWRAFMESAERSIATEESRKLAAAAAEASFASLADWFAACQHARRLLRQPSGCMQTG